MMFSRRSLNHRLVISRIRSLGSKQEAKGCLQLLCSLISISRRRRHSLQRQGTNHPHSISRTLSRKCMWTRIIFRRLRKHRHHDTHLVLNRSRQHPKSKPEPKTERTCIRKKSRSRAVLEPYSLLNKRSFLVQMWATTVPHNNHSILNFKNITAVTTNPNPLTP